MKRFMLNAKIHRCVTTGINADDVGSIAIDATLLRAANVVPHEKVQVVNINNGARWETVAVAAEANSGTIEINGTGTGAPLARPGDLLIVMVYVEVSEPVPANYQPTVVFADQFNRVADVLPMNVNGHPLPATAAPL